VGRQLIDLGKWWPIPLLALPFVAIAVRRYR
jgi:hypothetical protein